METGWTCSEAPCPDINTELLALYVTSDLISFLTPPPPRLGGLSLSDPTPPLTPSPLTSGLS